MPSTCLVAGVAALVLCTGAAAAPRLPTDDSEVLERLPAASSGPVRPLDRAGGEPDLDEAMVRAETWVRLALKTQDSRYAGWAQAALAPWWSLPEPPLRVAVLRAVLAQHRHDFTAALADLDQVLGRAPDDPQALLARAAIRLVLGDPGTSMDDCRELRATAAMLVATVCEALAASRSGRAELAVVVLEAAVADGAEVPSDLRAWTFTAVAEVALATGRDAVARTWLEAAYDAAPDDAFVLQALADLLLDAGEAGRVRTLIPADSLNDGHLLRRVLAGLDEGQPRGSAEEVLLRERFAAARLRGDSVAQREEARLLLATGEAPAALQLALDNWRHQREPWDARIVLEAARAADRADSARPVLTWIEATGIEDLRLRALAAELAGS